MLCFDCGQSTLVSTPLATCTKQQRSHMTNVEMYTQNTHTLRTPLIHRPPVATHDDFLLNRVDYYSYCVIHRSAQCEKYKHNDWQKPTIKGPTKCQTKCRERFVISTRKAHRTAHTTFRLTSSVFNVVVTVFFTSHSFAFNVSVFGQLLRFSEFQVVHVHLLMKQSCLLFLTSTRLRPDQGP